MRERSSFTLSLFSTQLIRVLSRRKGHASRRKLIYTLRGHHHSLSHTHTHTHTIPPTPQLTLNNYSLTLPYAERTRQSSTSKCVPAQRISANAKLDKQAHLHTCTHNTTKICMNKQEHISTCIHADPSTSILTFMQISVHVTSKHLIKEQDTGLCSNIGGINT